MTKLRSTLSFHRQYHYGTGTQVHGLLFVALPIILIESPILIRFMTPASNLVAQVTAYRIIANVLAPALEAHRYETFKHIEKRLATYVSIVDRADAQEMPASAEARALMLQQVVEEDRKAIAAAPQWDAPGSKFKILRLGK